MERNQKKGYVEARKGGSWQRGRTLNVGPTEDGTDEGDEYSSRSAGTGSGGVEGPVCEVKGLGFPAH